MNESHRSASLGLTATLIYQRVSVLLRILQICETIHNKNVPQHENKMFIHFGQSLHWLEHRKATLDQLIPICFSVVNKIGIKFSNFAIKSRTRQNKSVRDAPHCHVRTYAQAVFMYTGYWR